MTTNFSNNLFLLFLYGRIIKLISTIYYLFSGSVKYVIFRRKLRKRSRENRIELAATAAPLCGGTRH
jgi:hypothetical protein